MLIVSAVQNDFLLLSKPDLAEQGFVRFSFTAQSPLKKPVPQHCYEMFNLCSLFNSIAIEVTKHW